MKYRYCYRRTDGTPLTRCPHCSADLTAVNAVLVEVAINNLNSHFKTRLIPETGGLVDSDDGQVAKGFHSETSCARCQESLAEWEVNVDGLDDDGVDEGDSDLDETEYEREEIERLGRARLIINNAAELRYALIEKYGPQGEEIYDLILEHGEPIFGVVRAGE